MMLMTDLEGRTLLHYAIASKCSIQVLDVLLNATRYASSKLFAICPRSVLVEGETGFFEPHMMYDSLTGYAIVSASVNMLSQSDGVSREQSMSSSVRKQQSNAGTIELLDDMQTDDDLRADAKDGSSNKFLYSFFNLFSFNLLSLRLSDQDILNIFL